MSRRDSAKLLGIKQANSNDKSSARARSRIHNEDLASTALRILQRWSVKMASNGGQGMKRKLEQDPPVSPPPLKRKIHSTTTSELCYRLELRNEQHLTPTQRVQSPRSLCQLPRSPRKRQYGRNAHQTTIPQVHFSWEDLNPMQIKANRVVRPGGKLQLLIL